MSAFSVVINIFAVIGLLVILIYIIYYLWNSLQQKNFKMIESRINPPSEYMQQSGVKCPDYWVNTGVDANGNYILKISSIPIAYRDRVKKLLEINKKVEIDYPWWSFPQKIKEIGK
jgi:hypothetical protein